MSFSFESIYFDRPIIEGRVLDLFVPDAVSKNVALFFVHGGGWRSGSRTHFHALMQAFNDRGFVCASTDYRLKTNIEQQLGDVREGYRLFHQKLKSMGTTDKVVAIGSSAGAHLAALVALAKPGACGEAVFEDDYPPPPLAGAALQACPVTFKPWDDMFPPIWASMQGVVGTSYETAPERFARVSPIEHLKAGSPPVLLLHAENEHMFPRQQAEAFADRARSLGCRAELKTYANAEHGFFYDVTRNPQRAAFTDVLEFISSLAR